MIRIVGGKYRHRMLNQPEMAVTRCTKDSVKEGFFSSISPNINNSSFLDLFGGSGAIGIEAYSRGASNVFINEIDLNSLKIIKENLDSLNIKDINVINFDYLAALDYLNKLGIKFDIVFLDPPYKMNLSFPFIKILEEKNLLKENNIVIFETDIRQDINVSLNYKIKELKYGRTYVYVCRSLL